MTRVLEESSTRVSCLHKQISFVPFLVGVRSNHFGLRRYRPILRPVFVVVRFRYSHSFIPISFSSSNQTLDANCAILYIFIKYFNKLSKAYFIYYLFIFTNAN